MFLGETKSQQDLGHMAHCTLLRWAREHSWPDWLMCSEQDELTVDICSADVCVLGIYRVLKPGNFWLHLDPQFFLGSQNCFDKHKHCIPLWPQRAGLSCWTITTHIITHLSQGELCTETLVCRHLYPLCPGKTMQTQKFHYSLFLSRSRSRSWSTDSRGLAVISQSNSSASRWMNRFPVQHLIWRLDSVSSTET